MSVPPNPDLPHDGEIRADQPAVVFLHPFGGSSRTWREVVRRLEGDVRCIAPDFRGFGRLAGSVLPGVGYAVDDYADDVIEMIGQLGLKAFVLAGHSMGGKVALAVAARRPAGLRALVLIAPSPPTPEPMDDAERARLLAAHGNAEAMRQTIGKIIAGPLPPGVLDRTVEDYTRSAPAAWRAWLESGSREDISAAVDRIDVPALVVAGAVDPVMPAALLAREVVGRLGSARLHTVPDAGHLLPLEAAHDIAALVRGEVTTCI